MKIELDSSEIQWIKMSLDNSDPFTTVKDAESRVYTTKQRIKDLEKQLKIDEETLSRLKARDAMVEKLKSKIQEGVEDE